MCLQKILQQNANFDSFRKELISKSTYFPEVTVMVQSDTCVCACTIVRKKQDGVWYKNPVISLHYTPTSVNMVKPDMTFLIQKTINDAYMNMILSVINLDLKTADGRPVFIKDDCQMDEEQRLILETKVLRNNI